MNRKEATELLPIIQAYAEGKEIEIFDKTMKMWKTAMLPHFDCDSNNYRIKPESTYRPFKDAEECWAEMQKHQPFGWVKDKDTQKFLVCKALGKLFFIGIEDKPYNYKEVLRDYTFADGTPFGVEVEEQYGVLFL